MRSDRERLLDIQEAIGKIEQHTSSDIEAFADDEMQQVWVIHHLRIVGEAAYGLSQQFRARHPQIPWEQIIGMRHVLVHGYFEIDPDIVWAVIEKDLPPLKSASEAILHQSNGA
ncbi:MAG: nucleotidyltransferase [Chloroflexi bacterium HGW-Chloroflexi-1]|nr:MAG: nucleotidyltransferase [Chloroflexi bacterium HGW-Chloroflexi-1]